jgi:hypothetical protein
MTAIGDMAVYQAYQIGNAIPAAAANPAGGIAGAGIGLGMGVAMAGTMVNPLAGRASMASPIDANPTAAMAPSPALVVAWHIAENGAPVGPFTSTQLAQAIAAGRVTRDTLVWSPGMSGWVGASQVAILQGLFVATPPPIPRN